jgi:AcrR family transcriptional regulator
MLNLIKYHGNYFSVKSFYIIFANSKLEEIKPIMKDKIIKNATEMFLKLGFKSVTMDDIAMDLNISKKTIYKYFSNKEQLIIEGTDIVHKKVQQTIQEIVLKNYNAIEENFEIKKMFRNMFQMFDTSPLFQLKKHYPEIYSKMIETEINYCSEIFETNIKKGIQEELYRKDLDIEASVKFYYSLIFYIHENIPKESETLKMEILALEYHTRAISTPKGIKELEKQLLNIK